MRQKEPFHPMDEAGARPGRAQMQTAGTPGGTAQVPGRKLAARPWIKFRVWSTESRGPGGLATHSDGGPSQDREYAFQANRDRERIRQEPRSGGTGEHSSLGYREAKQEACYWVWGDKVGCHLIRKEA